MKVQNGCPFCQQHVIQIIKSRPTDTEGFQAQCENCGACGPIYEDEQDAITGWEEGIADQGKRLRQN